MSQYELQPTPEDPASILSPAERDPATTSTEAEYTGLVRRNRVAPEAIPQDPILQALTMVQRQQAEQSRLLRQLLQEIEALKASQSAQTSTVTKLDRRMQRARFFRISWGILRTAIFAAGIGFIIYVIGIDQIQAIWARLVWLFS